MRYGDDIVSVINFIELNKFCMQSPTRVLIEP